MIENDDVLTRRINRINQLLARLDRIPEELREIETKLHKGGICRDEFAHLVDKRNALIIEHERVERELRQEYKLRTNDQQ